MAEQQDSKRASSSRRQEGALHVTATMVTARTANDRIVYFYKGDTLPEDIPQETVDHLKSLGFVTEDDVPLP
jgi:hypothetical protein